MAGFTWNMAELANKCKQGLGALKELITGHDPDLHVFTVPQDTLGLIYDHGELVEVLQEGKYAREKRLQKQFIKMEGRVSPVLAKNILKVAPYMESNLAIFELSEGQIGVYRELMRDRIYASKEPGSYAWWGNPGQYVWTALDLHHPEQYWLQLPDAYKKLLEENNFVTTGFLRAESEQYHNSILLHYYKNALVEVITKPGDYLFSNADGQHLLKPIAYNLPCLPTYAKEPLLADYIKTVELKPNQILFVKTRNFDGDDVSCFTDARLYYFWNLPNHEIEFRVYDTSHLAIPRDEIRDILEFCGSSGWKVSHNGYIASIQDSSSFVINRNKMVQKYDDAKDACEYQGSVYVWGKNANHKYKNYSVVDVCRSGKKNEPSNSAYTKDKIMVKIAYFVSYAIPDSEKLLYKLFEWNARPADSWDNLDSDQLVWDHVSWAIFEHIRNEIAKYTLEEFLENRVTIEKDILGSLKAVAEEACIEIHKVYISQVGLTKEVQRSLEQVIMAEKKAQVKAIERRDEVAANRSLANTAKLLEDHPSAMVLRKLQTLEALSDKIGTLNLNFEDK